MHHRTSFQVQDQRHVTVTFAHGNLVDGDLLEVLELRLGELLLQIVFLNVFDEIPAHAQMLGHIFDGGVTGKFQRITRERLSVRATRLGEGERGLPR